MRFNFLSRAPRGEGDRSEAPRSPKKALRSPRSDRVVLTITIAILALALGLIPLFILATARNPGRAVISRPPNTATTTTVPSRAPVATPVAASQPTVEPTSPAAQTPVPLPTVSLGDARFAVLLMGYGGGSHDGAYLTDSMMVVIVDPGQKTLTLLSLPRDSWVPMLFDGKTPTYNKVNTAYAFARDSSLFPNRLDKYTGGHGAGVFTSDTVSRLLGIPISYYVALDFDGFRQMINAVGGIDVDVPNGFTARYPINDDPTIDAGWMIIHFNSGSQHMDGERAIEYARARETIDDSGEGSDFARSRRQRLIIQAFKQRLTQPSGLVHLPQLISIASQHLDTNYAIPAVAQLSQLVLGWQDVHFYQTALTSGNYLQQGTGTDGTFLLVPTATGHSWAAIRAFTRHLWDNPAAGVAMAATTIVVQNDSGSPSLGDRVSNDLALLGYQVATPTVGTFRETSQVVDESGGQAAPLIVSLGNDLGLKDLSSVDPTMSGSDQTVALKSGSGSEVILELGADAIDLSLSVPDDLLAPSSNVGVAEFGQWSPETELATPTPETTPLPGAEKSGKMPTLTPIPSAATPIAVPGSPNEVIVPRLIGLPESTAQRIINESGLMTTYVNYQTSNEVADHNFFLSTAPGAVLSQQPPPGTKVSRGTRVALAVRKP